MDLAHTPSLAERQPQARRTRGVAGGLRLMSPAEVAQPAFRAAWEALASDASDPNPFFEPWFALPSLAHFGDAGKVQIAAHFDGDRLTGLLPLARRSDYYGYPILHAAAWLHDNAFCGLPLISRGFERSFWRALLAQLDERPGGALFLHLPQMPSDSRTAHALEAVGKETGRQVVCVEQAERAMLASELSPQDYYTQSMTPKRRKELRRLQKRLAEEGTLTFERCNGSKDIERWIAQFLALEAAGWKGEAGSALANAAATRGLFTEAMSGAAQAGRLECLALHIDGNPIAMLASFVTPPGVFSFKTAFDERFARYSPGLLLQIENLDLLARDDIAWADSCAVEGHSMIERIWREKRPISSLNIAIGGPVRRTAFRALMAYETRGRTSKKEL